MGIFGFLKKSKADTTEIGMELPPVPKFEDFGGMDSFPEIKSPELAPLPETMLPPLPTEVPTAVPPRPEERKLEAPKVELPKAQEMPAPMRMEPAPMMQAQQMPHPPELSEEAHEQFARAEFPSIAQMPSEEIVPDKVPPLEGLPEPPSFSTAFTAPARSQTLEPEPRMIEPREMPRMFLAPEEPHIPKKRMPLGPLFIRTDQFRTALENVEMIRAKFSEEDDLFFRVNEVKSAQDQKYEQFRQTLEDMQRKLLFIDKSLFESR
jgi:hypothetical protein